MPKQPNTSKPTIATLPGPGVSAKARRLPQGPRTLKRSHPPRPGARPRHPTEQAPRTLTTPSGGGSKTSPSTPSTRHLVVSLPDVHKPDGERRKGA